MTYGGFLLRHPLFWAFVVGLLTGAAVAAATSVRSRRVRAARDPSRVAARRWAYVWLALGLAIAAGTVGLLVTSDERFLRLESVYVSVAGLVLCAVALRFPRAGGVPVLLIAGTVAVLGATAVRGYLPVRDPRPVATLSVIALRPDSMTLEVSPGAPEEALVPAIVNARASELVAEIDLLDLSDALFLLGAGRYVRYVGPGGPGPVEPRGPLAWLLAVESVTLASLERRSVVAERLNVLRSYRLVVPAAGEPAFRPL